MIPVYSRTSSLDSFVVEQLSWCQLMLWGIKSFIFIPMPLDIASKSDWMEVAPNALNSQALPYDVRLIAGSRNQWMYTSSLQSAGQLEWKRQLPCQLNLEPSCCRNVSVSWCVNGKLLILGKCHANKQVIYKKFPISMCNFTTCTWQDLPLIFPSLSRIRIDLKTTNSMSGLAQCTFEIKFDAVP